jgi:methylmalonyl-CoA mutase N-terminal domain/subunit
MDETIALPSDKAVKIALRTQQIIAHELGVTETIDPLAGSYYVEHLTNTLEEKAEDYFRQIDAMGGVVAGIEQGFFQREIGRAATSISRDGEEAARHRRRQRVRRARREDRHPAALHHRSGREGAGAGAGRAAAHPRQQGVQLGAEVADRRRRERPRRAETSWRRSSTARVPTPPRARSANAMREVFGDHVENAEF